MAANDWDVRCVQWSLNHCYDDDIEKICLRTMFEDRNFDIILLSGTRGHVPETPNTFAEYHSPPIISRRGGITGGVSVFVRKSTLRVSEGVRPVLGDDTVILQFEKFSFIGMHDIKRGEDEWRVELLDKLGRALLRTPSDRPILLAGNLNCRIDPNVSNPDPRVVDQLNQTKIFLKYLEGADFTVRSLPDVRTYYKDCLGPAEAPDRSFSSTNALFVWRGGQNILAFDGHSENLNEILFRTPDREADSGFKKISRHVPVSVSLKFDGYRNDVGAMLLPHIDLNIPLEAEAELVLTTMLAMDTVEDPARRDADRAAEAFKERISPILTRGMTTESWMGLHVGELKRLNAVYIRFMKRALGLERYASDGLVRKRWIERIGRRAPRLFNYIEFLDSEYRRAQDPTEAFTDFMTYFADSMRNVEEIFVLAMPVLR